MGPLAFAYRSLLRLPAFKGKARLEDLYRRVLGPDVFVCAHGLEMELDPLEWAQIDIMINSALEPLTAGLFSRLLVDGDTYVDIGAHVGFHALVARKFVGSRGRVIAVEPQPYNCDKLLINSALNGFDNIVVIVAAAGAADGFVTLRNQVATDKSRLTLLGEGVGDTSQRFDVPLLRVDTIATRNRVGRIKLLKIDVEGFELEVLRGATAALGITENIIFESLPDTGYETRGEIFRLLSDAGFRMSDVRGAQWRPGMTLVENNVWATRNP